MLLVAVPLLSTGCLSVATGGLRLAASSVDRDRVDRALAENPDNPHAWLMLGRSDLSLGEHADARSAFRRALRAQPDLEEARLGIGIAYMEQKRWARATETFEDWIDFNPKALGAWTGLAAAHYGAGNLDGAKQAAHVALEIEPNDMQAHRILGEVAYARKDFEAALFHWRQALRDGSQASELELIVKDMEKYLAKYGEPTQAASD